ncbi:MULTISPECIES: TonB family protein [unclassified Sinorhizobium]|uniref:energy transducer TonB n=1 Tax=unclassified Sinorhizobium TaxID=2613772 RepID=UPI0035259493
MADTQNVGSLNDNNPGMHPGHQLSDLDGVPRQPAGESVVHYGRFAQIGSFPEHPSDRDPATKTDAPEMDASPERHAEGIKPGGKRVTFACLASAFFHMSLVLAIAVVVGAPPQLPDNEAGEVVNLIMLGASEMDEAAAGKPEEDPPPEEIVPEAVQPEIVQTTEVQPTEVQPTEVQEVMPQAAETVEAEPSEPTQQTQEISPETVTAAEPEVLTSLGPAETSVVQPMAAAVPDEVSPVEPQEPVEVLPEPPPPQDVAVPVAKPQTTKSIEKPKEVVKKPPPKKAKVVAGSDGEGNRNSTKGFADGTETGKSDQNSKAAKDKYGSKVTARIRRALRGAPAEYTRMEVTVSVQIRIESDGALTALSVVRSSGVPDLDQFVLDAVRRAAPFPTIPADVVKPAIFTQAIGVKR